jgi:hypothetical protein
MTAWNDFNDAEQQKSYDLIPKGTVARVRMTIKPGGYDDAQQGWAGGYATQSYETGSIFLACEFVVLEGDYARRKMWSNVGLFSPKGPTWTNMGRTFIRAALNSAHNVHPQDNSPQAANARRIRGFEELDGLEFMARIDVEKDGRGEARNVVKAAVEPGEAQYGVGGGAVHQGPAYAPPQAAAPQHFTPSPQFAPPMASRPVPGAGAPAAATPPAANGKPAWAQ